MDWTVFVSGWTGIVAVILCTIVGLWMASASAVSHWRTKSIAWASVAFAGLGIVLSTVSKWTEIAIKYNDYEIKLTKAEEQNQILQSASAKLTLENQNLNLKLVQFANLKDVIESRPQYVQADQAAWSAALSSGGLQGSYAMDAIKAMEAAGWVAVKPNQGVPLVWDPAKPWTDLNGVLVSPN